MTSPVIHTILAALLIAIPNTLLAQVWLEKFGQPTITGNIRSVAIADSQLYVSGNIFSVAGRRTRGLAVLDHFNTPNHARWSAVPLALDGGFSQMAYFDNGVDQALYGVGACCDNALVRIHNGIATEVEVAGRVSGIATVDFYTGRKLVASGQFTHDDTNYGLAIWDGDAWRYRSELLNQTNNLTVLERNGRQRIYALGSSRRKQLVEFDGFELIYREIPLIEEAIAISHVSGSLAVCDSSFYGSLLPLFDGIRWSFPLIINPCRALANQPLINGDRMLIKGTGGHWTVVTGPGMPAVSKSLPPNLDDRTAILSSGPALLALGTRSGQQLNRQLAVWDLSRWTYPEQIYQVDKPRLELTAVQQRGDDTYLIGAVGQPGEAPGGPLTPSVAKLDDGRISEVWPIPANANAAVVGNNNTLYATVNNGLWIRQNNNTQVIATPVPTYSLAITHDGSLLLSDCGRQIFELVDNQVNLLATMGIDELIQCDRGLVTVRESSPAGGIYIVSYRNVGTNFSGSFPVFSVYRLEGSTPIDVSPPGLVAWREGIIPALELSVVTINNEQLPIARFGETVTYYDGVSWQPLPDLPDGRVSGPLAYHGVPGKECFYAGEILGLARLCNGTWERPQSLTFRSTEPSFNSRFRPFLSALTPSWQQGRPVLIVAGQFDTAGDASQSRTAVLDLDAISIDSFEF